MTFSRQHSIYHSTDQVSSNGYPPALKCLVFVWDELNKDFQAFVNKIITDKEKDTLLLPRINQCDMSETEYPRNSLKNRKSTDEGNTSLGAVGGSSESTIWCELCDTDIVPGSHQSPYQQNAFTQHLKTNHPGCGESAKGKGFNSNGVYCEGWAGQCGEEGVGATSWYLMCEQCRDKFLTPNKKTLLVNESLLSRAANLDQKLLPPPNINPSTFTKKSKFNANMSGEFFEIMKENALFLLDINSHNAGLLNKTAGNSILPLKNKMTARHSTASEFVAQPNTSNFAQRLSANVIDDNLRKANSIQKQSSSANIHSKKNHGASIDFPTTELIWTPPESITCLEMLNAKISESDSCNAFALDNDRNVYDPVGAHRSNQNPDGVSSNENKFHRSFSMVQGWGFYSLNSIAQDSLNHGTNSGGNQDHQNNENKVIMRRKKTCLCDSCKFECFGDENKKINSSINPPQRMKRAY